MPDLRNSRFWDKQLEGGLPDCRLSPTMRERSIVMRGRMAWETIFCANCGAAWGLVTAEWSAHVFCICDPCFEKLGPPPGSVQVPDETVRGGAEKPPGVPKLEVPQ